MYSDSIKAFRVAPEEVRQQARDAAKSNRSVGGGSSDGYSESGK